MKQFILPAVKIEPQTDTRKCLVIFSRIRDAEIRRNLEIDGDGWGGGCTFYDEKKAQQEYSWLVSHNLIREYLLVARVEKKPHDALRRLTSRGVRAIMVLRQR